MIGLGNLYDRELFNKRSCWIFTGIFWVKLYIFTLGQPSAIFSRHLNVISLWFLKKCGEKGNPSDCVRNKAKFFLFLLKIRMFCTVAWHVRTPHVIRYVYLEMEKDKKKYVDIPPLPSSFCFIKILNPPPKMFLLKYKLNLSIIKKLNLCHKFQFSNPYIFAT